jgi:hypothetical protein
MKLRGVAIGLLTCAVACGDVPDDDPTESDGQPSSQAKASPARDVETITSAATLSFAPVMTVTVRTGGDDLRGDDIRTNHSTAMISVLRGDGRWSSEKAFSLHDANGKFLDNLVLSDPQQLPENTTWQYTFNGDGSNWDGFDACATSVRVRLAQGSCFLCGSDDWNISWLAVDYQADRRYAAWRMANLGSVRLTKAAGTVTFAATQTPAGETCNSGLVADCHGAPQDSANEQAWSTDWGCDDGGWGLFLNCSAFKYDSGKCGQPSSWTCPSDYYGTLDGCDCDCGAWDPDCNTAGQKLYGCSSAPNMICMNNKVSPGVYGPLCYQNTVVK